MAAAAGAVLVVVHRGNTPEKIAEYEEIYDYSRVQKHLQQEAKRWFGYHPRPQGYSTEYYLWRKWNDPRRTKAVHYEVQYGKSPILLKETGELALSPTVFKQKLYKNGENDVRELFEKLRRYFSDKNEPVPEDKARTEEEARTQEEARTEEEAGTEDKARTEEEAGADEVEDDVAKKMLKLKMS
jgi:hypothetical protein